MNAFSPILHLEFRGANWRIGFVPAVLRRVTFEPEAGSDAEAAFDWYESREAGLGWEFLAALRQASQAIAENPEIYPLRQKGYRCYLIGRFPYAIYFKYDDANIFVVAVFHGSRHPLRLRSRFRSLPD